MADKNSNDFSEARKSLRPPSVPPNRTGTVISIYALTLFVALVFFLRGYHKTSYAVDIGVWFALVAWLKLRGRE